MKIKDGLKVLITFTIIIFLPFGAFVWYVQPINESFTCDSKRVCVFEQTRFPNIQENKYFYIYPEFKLEYQQKYVNPNRKNLFGLAGYNHTFLFNKERIFDFPYCIDERNDICKIYVDNVLVNFEEYKKMPELGFHLSSLAKERNRFWFGILFTFTFWLIMAWTCYIDTDEYKNREKKNKKTKKKRNIRRK